ncbi:MAG: thiolase family protein [Dehalococcoidia bacterium]|nr:thiolase family protein [Dehalococcoidia bacterium]
MEPVYILGVGMHPFGRYPDKLISDMVEDAVTDALKDAGLAWQDIELAYAANGQPGQHGQRFLRGLGLSGVPIINVENACAGGSSAFFSACMAVGAGAADVALAVGYEQMARGMIGANMARPMTHESVNGLFAMPGMFGMVARNLMHEHGVTARDLALVSVKNHHNGVFNPRAQYRMETPVEDVLASRMIADPLTLLMCAPTTDGAAAVVVGSRRAAARYANGVYIRLVAAAQRSEPYAGTEVSRPDIRTMTMQASRAAYEQGGLGPEDLDLVELHDCFAPAEISHYENLGLCAVGDGAKLVREGATNIEGRIPVNPSGGLLSKGHPISATGAAQICELTWQLRGEAGQRQVAGRSGQGPTIGLAHNPGGITASLSFAHVNVHILKREDALA